MHMKEPMVTLDGFHEICQSVLKQRNLPILCAPYPTMFAMLAALPAPNDAPFPTTIAAEMFNLVCEHMGLELADLLLGPTLQAQTRMPSKELVRMGFPSHPNASWMTDVMACTLGQAPPMTSEMLRCLLQLGGRVVGANMRVQCFLHMQGELLQTNTTLDVIVSEYAPTYDVAVCLGLGYSCLLQPTLPLARQQLPRETSALNLSSSSSMQSVHQDFARVCTTGKSVRSDWPLHFLEWHCTLSLTIKAARKEDLPDTLLQLDGRFFAKLVKADGSWSLVPSFLPGMVTGYLTKKGEVHMQVITGAETSATAQMKLSEHMYGSRDAVESMELYATVFERASQRDGLPPYLVAAVGPFEILATRPADVDEYVSAEGSLNPEAPSEEAEDTVWKYCYDLVSSRQYLIPVGRQVSMSGPYVPYIRSFPYLGLAPSSCLEAELHDAVSRHPIAHSVQEGVAVDLVCWNRCDTELEVTISQGLAGDSSAPPTNLTLRKTVTIGPGSSVVVAFRTGFTYEQTMPFAVLRFSVSGQEVASMRFRTVPSAYRQHAVVVGASYFDVRAPTLLAQFTDAAEVYNLLRHSFGYTATLLCGVEATAERISQECKNAGRNLNLHVVVYLSGFALREPGRDFHSFCSSDVTTADVAPCSSDVTAPKVAPCSPDDAAPLVFPVSLRKLEDAINCDGHSRSVCFWIDAAANKRSLPTLVTQDVDTRVCRLKESPVAVVEEVTEEAHALILSLLGDAYEATILPDGSLVASVFTYVLIATVYARWEQIASLSAETLLSLTRQVMNDWIAPLVTSEELRLESPRQKEKMDDERSSSQEEWEEREAREKERADRRKLNPFLGSDAAASMWERRLKLKMTPRQSLMLDHGTLDLVEEGDYQVMQAGRPIGEVKVVEVSRYGSTITKESGEKLLGGLKRPSHDAAPTDDARLSPKQMADLERVADIAQLLENCYLEKKEKEKEPAQPASVVLLGREGAFGYSTIVERLATWGVKFGFMREQLRPGQIFVEYANTTDSMSKALQAFIIINGRKKMLLPPSTEPATFCKHIGILLRHDAACTFAQAHLHSVLRKDIEVLLLRRNYTGSHFEHKLVEVYSSLSPVTATPTFLECRSLDGGNEADVRTGDRLQVRVKLPDGGRGLSKMAWEALWIEADGAISIVEPVRPTAGDLDYEDSTIYALYHGKRFLLSESRVEYLLLYFADDRKLLPSSRLSKDDQERMKHGIREGYAPRLLLDIPDRSFVDVTLRAGPDVSLHVVPILLQANY